MKISPRNKFWITIIVVLIGAFIIFNIISELNEIYQNILFFGWLVIGSMIMIAVRCPNCGTPIVFQGKILNFSFFAGFAHKRCKKCGHDLTI